jgi:hypothetical protein
MPAATLLSAALLAAALVAGVLLTGGAAGFAGSAANAGAVAAPPLPALLTSREPGLVMAFVFLAGLGLPSRAAVAPIGAMSAGAAAAVSVAARSPAGSAALIQPRRLVFGPKPLPFAPRPLDALFTIPGLAILRR